MTNRKNITTDKLYKNVFELCPSSIITVGSDGIIMSCNSATEEITGITEDELVGTHFEDIEALKSSGNIAICRQMFGSILSGNIPPPFEIEFKHLDGTNRAAQIHIGLLREDEKIIGLQAISNDMTVQKKMEKELKKSKERYRQLFESSNDAIMLLDRERFFDCNQATLNMFEYKTREEFCSKHPGEVSPPVQSDGVGSREAADERIEFAFEQRKNFFEWTHRRANGEDFPADVLLTPVIIEGKEVLQATVRDITDRKKAEEDLKENLRLNTMLMDSLPHPAMIIKKDKTILAANRIAREGGAKIGGLCWRDFGQSEYIFEEDKKYIKKHSESSCNTHCTFCLANECLTDNNLTNTLEVNVFSKIWDIYWVALDSDTYLHYSIDITEYKQAEEEKEKLQEQLFQAQKMEAVGTLAAGVGHDFNNVLAAILSASSLLEYELGPNHPNAEDVTLIMDAARRGRNSTKQLMAFGRTTDTQIRSMNCNDLIKENLKMLHLLLPESVEIIPVLGDDLQNTKMDEGLMDRILTNFASNAGDAMPKGGKLIIKTRNLHLNGDEGKQYIGLSPGDYIKLSVADTGKGMSKKTLKHIFEPFWTTKPKGEAMGRGQGLYIVYSIVKQQLGGNIYVNSKPGKGTTFEILLPICGKPIKKKKKKTSSQSKNLKKEGNVLVVDDNDLVQNSISKMLQRIGFHVFTAENGQIALDLVQTTREKIDFALVDVVMPVMSGIDFSKELNKMIEKGGLPREKGNFPIVFMSGHSDGRMNKHGLIPKEMSFLGKPFTLNELLKVIDETMEQEEVVGEED